MQSVATQGLCRKLLDDFIRIALIASFAPVVVVNEITAVTMLASQVTPK